MKAYERLLSYVKVFTPSSEETGTSPSTQYQFDLARLLVQELKELGVKEAKRTAISEYRLQGRNGFGVKAVQLAEGRGSLVGALIVSEDDQVMAIMKSGKVIRSNVTEVKRTGRTTQGVTLAKPDKGDEIISIARNEETGEDEVETTDDTAAAASATTSPDTAENTPDTADSVASGSDSGAASDENVNNTDDEA